MNVITQFVKQIIKLLHWLEDAGIITLLMLMLGMSVYQVAARNFGFAGFIWFDTATKLIVLWLAMLGAMRGARLRNHIAIDLISHYATGLTLRAMHFITYFTSAAICFTAAYYCFLFVREEYNYPMNAFLNVPTWLAESIIPFALFVIAWRILLSAFCPAEPSTNTHSNDALES